MFFSIVIPTYSRPARLKRCLESIARLDRPPHAFEVVVVDDGGKAPLDALIESFCAAINISLIRQSNAGPAAARNRGAASARGEVFVFTDDDCQFAQDYLVKLSCYYATTPEHLVGGRTINALTDNLYSASSQLLVDYLFSYYNHGCVPPSFFTSNNLAVPAAGFHELAGFDTGFRHAGGEDRHFCDYWVARGFKSTYAPDATVYHSHELTLSSFCRQHYVYGRGAFDFHKKRAQRGDGVVKMEPVKFYLDLLCFPFAGKQSSRRLSTTLLLAISQVANAVGYYRERTMRALHALVSP